MYGMENFQNKPLADRVADNILSYIVDNELSVGEKIPNEFELAESLGVGRSTVREAIKILVSKNVLEIRRGSGTFISDKMGVSDDPLGLSFIKDRHKLAMDLLNVRFLLEPAIAAMAAKHATEEQMEALVKQCERVEEMLMAGENHIEEDIKLHKIIASCSGNSVMENLIPIINSSVAVFANVTQRKLRDETIETHREVVNAILCRDEEGAKYAMEMHLIYNRRMIWKIMKDREKA